MKESSPNRRTFLKGTAATASMAAIAGCSNVPFFGGNGSTGHVNTWLPAPYELGRNIDFYSVSATAPSAVAPYETEIGIENWEAYVSGNVDTIPYATPTASDLSLVASAEFWEEGGLSGDFDVYEGEFSPERIEERIDGEEQYSFTRGSYEEFEYFVTDDDTGALAVSEDTFLEASTTDADELDSVALIDMVVDANEGHIDRYEENEDFETLFEKASEGEGVAYILNLGGYDGPDDPDPGQGELFGYIGLASSRQLEGAETEIEERLLFENEGDIVDSEIETYVTESGFYDSWRTIDWEQDGRTVSIDGTIRSVDSWES